jgi:hypothetical protein
MRSTGLPILALLLPYSIHHCVRNIPNGLWQAEGFLLSSWRENAAGDQLLFALRLRLETAGHKPGHRLVSVADYYFLTSANSPDMGTEASLQFGNIYGAHENDSNTT